MAPAQISVFTSDVCLLHAPTYEFLGGAETQYYESPDRLTAIAKWLESRPDKRFVFNKDIVDYGMAPIRKIHKPDFLEYLQTAYDEWIQEGGHPHGVAPATIPHQRLARLGKVKPNTPTGKSGEYCFDLSAVIMKDTWRAAYESAQVTLTAAGELKRLADQQGQTTGATHPPGVYALCRPPGHHAQTDLCGGYCYLNNVAIATQWLIDQPQKDGRPSRVAVLDIDYHHGNGTQEIFYTVKNPLYTSLHNAQDYPYFTGAKEEQGEGEGLGFNINVPMPGSTNNDEYVAALQKIIDNHVLPFAPDYIIVSLGVDTFKDDPIAGFQLTSEAYPRMGEAIRRIGVPTLFVQEGGYCIEKIGLNVGGVLEGFGGFQ
ncbi:hypothetical protein BGZ73_005278 [Actinomortierella ambigua]|nr:hypothetical protein BGZ73_005278 [Actinomortierella ambigua]